MASRIVLPLGALLLALLLAAGGCAVRPEGEEKAGDGPENSAVEAASVTLTYYGQAAFLIDAGPRILIDPYRPELGYGRIDLPADLVTISHHHFDHDYAEAGRGARVLRGLSPDGEWQQVEEDTGFARIYSVGSYHDSSGGCQLGKNSIFVIEVAGLRLVHAGDLGYALGAEEIKRIGPVDLLFIPVGGYYTLPYEAILQVIADLKPAVAIPMHYRTRHYGDFNLGTLEDFLNQDLPYPACKKGSRIQVSKKDLPPSTEIWAMEYELP
jgi:L-ascorbate metabolism protein UlaG (beta-lactamase superfamily)